MKAKHTIIFILLILLQSLKYTSVASSPNPYFYFKQISIADGLPSSVTSIYDDNNGFLWIGTIDGLFRFDGEKLKRYDIDSSPMSSHLYIHAIKGNYNNCVAVLSSKGVSLYNPDDDKFELCKYERNDYQVHSLALDGNNIIVPLKGRFIYYDDNRKIVRKLKLSHNDAFLKVDEYDKGNYICLGSDRKLYIVDKHTGKTHASTLCNNEKVYTFSRDFRNFYWVSIYGKGVSCFSAKGELISHFSTMNSNLSNDVVLDISERNKQIWLATDGGGVNIINPTNNSIRIFSNKYEHNFPANSVACLCNGTNNMWIGLVREGLLGAKENFITSYTRAPFGSKLGMSEKCPASLLQDSGGLVWIGTDGGGLNCFNPVTNEFTHFPSTKDDKIISICNYSPNKLLLSLFSKGFFIFNKNTGQYENQIKIDEELKDKLVYSGVPYNIYSFEDGSIMTFSNSIYKLDKESNFFKRVNTSNGINDNLSWIYIGNKDNILFFKNSNSIISYNKEQNKATTLYHENGTILAACIDKNGQFWISTNNGIKHFDIRQGISEVIHIPDESRNATSLISDKNNNLWIGTLGYIYAYSPSRHEFTLFGESDGVIPNDFLPKPVLVTKDNNIYLGGSEGLTRILGKSFYTNSKNEGTTSISLLELVLDGKRVIPFIQDGCYNIEVNNNYTSLSIHTFARKTDIFKKRIYRYYIEGLNDDFIQSSRSYITLQNLPSGTYNVWVDYMQSNGTWSHKFHLLRLSVLYPWYMNRWFILFPCWFLHLSLLLLSIIIILYLNERLWIRNASSIKKK